MFFNTAAATDIVSQGGTHQVEQMIRSVFDIDVRMRVDGASSVWMARWQVDGRDASTVTIGRRLGDGSPSPKVHWRIFDFLPIVAAYHQQQGPRGAITVNLEDYGHTPGIAFCDRLPDRLLVPDPFFLVRDGYADMRAHFADHDVAWTDRAPVAFWRGADFSHDGTKTWEGFHRGRLYDMTRDSPIFDVGFSQIRDGRFRDRITLVPHVPPTHLNRYRIHIDIDGRTNSWPGLFLKLLSGSSVLKVASPYRQWYYDRLKPWENFVPVAADMSDLAARAMYLLDHPAEAQQIGAAGRRLAESMTFDSEMDAIMPVIAEHMQAHV